jgi:hypothetical protein
LFLLELQMEAFFPLLPEEFGKIRLPEVFAVKRAVRNSGRSIGFTLKTMSSERFPGSPSGPGLKDVVGSNPAGGTTTNFR